jgi:hypothetical protein
MNSRKNTLSAAALALVVCLSTAPIASAAVYRDRDGFDGVAERIVRVIKKVQNFFGGVIAQTDQPIPPRP